jgi:hypothetical protein
MDIGTGQLLFTFKPRTFVQDISTFNLQRNEDISVSILSSGADLEISGLRYVSSVI